MHPAGMARSDELRTAALFLLTHAASFVTGAKLCVVSRMRQ